ncbi:MAG TPA: Uma2 family endonuclease [Thermoanaerobaculia bacterium]|nr:Uma2 family endonuclease [Thermoanaerobaculia bacterium]
MTVDTQITADELLRMPDDGWRYELVQGELRKLSPAGEEHGDIAIEIATSLRHYVKHHRLGKAYGPDVGFRIARDPDTVRSPDAAFVSAERVVRTPKYFEGPPDVAFEVISPSDSYSDVEEKTLDYLRAGTRVVVVVNPRTRVVRLHRRDGVETVNDVLEIEDVIPGWRLPLAELFEE